MLEQGGGLKPLSYTKRMSKFNADWIHGKLLGKSRAEKNFLNSTQLSTRRQQLPLHLMKETGRVPTFCDVLRVPASASFVPHFSQGKDTNVPRIRKEETGPYVKHDTIYFKEPAILLCKSSKMYAWTVCSGIIFPSWKTWHSKDINSPPNWCISLTPSILKSQQLFRGYWQDCSKIWWK